MALLGKANAGKSTILNKLLAEKISIVSPKPNTTRRRVQGILSRPDCQIVFIDAPGFYTSRRNALGELIKGEGSQAEWEADVRVLCIDSDGLVSKGSINASKLESDLDASLRMLDKEPHLLVLNKIDKFKEDLVLPLISKVSEYFSSRDMELPEIYPLSGLKGFGLEKFLSGLSSRLPEGEAVFPSDQLSTLNERDFVAELVREQLFIFLNREVPYGTAVYVEAFKETEKLLDISAVVVVGKASHKGIVIGKGASNLKRVGIGARKVIEKAFGVKVNLKLHVKVSENWVESEAKIKNLGI